MGYVSRTFYPELLRAGIDVYLYQEGVLHAKVMIIDGETCVLGAANYDLRSFRTNYEVCQVVYSQALANYLERQFEADLQRSTPLNARWLANIPLGSGRWSAWLDCLRRCCNGVHGTVRFTGIS
ncbi:hypothetical protein GCM10025857_00950 [Alicyclobacillus contaminans]|nr:hypothetical protein GCM10025857_00950 [Alicyclobacillus contaminans]